MEMRTKSIDFLWFDDSGSKIGESGFELTEGTFSIPFRRGDFVRSRHTPEGNSDVFRFEGFVGEINHEIDLGEIAGVLTLVHTITVSFTRSTKTAESSLSGAP